MKGSYKYILNDKVLLINFLGSVVFLSISILFTAFSYAHLPPYIPIYNRIVWGYGRLGNKFEIFIPIVIALFFFLFDSVLSARMYNKEPLLSRLISVASFILCLLSCIFIIKIITLVL